MSTACCPHYRAKQGQTGPDLIMSYMKFTQIAYNYHPCSQVVSEDDDLQVQLSSIVFFKCYYSLEINIVFIVTSTPYIDFKNKFTHHH